MHAWYMCVLYINLYLVQTSTVEALEGVGGMSSAEHRTVLH